MKKITIIISLILICSVFYSSFVYADESPAFVVGEMQAMPGEEVEIPVSVVNNPGIACISLAVQYDASVLDWVSVEEGNLDGIWDTGVGQNEVWISSDNWYENAPVIFLRFQVKETATEGKAEVSVSYAAGDVFDSDGKDVYFDTVSGGIVVSNPESKAEDPIKDAVPGTGQPAVNQIEIPDLGQVITYDYDEAGRQTAEYTYEGDILTYSRELEYNVDGKVTSEVQTTWQDDGTAVTVTLEYIYLVDGTIEIHSVDSEGREETIFRMNDFRGNCILEEVHTDNEQIVRTLWEYDDHDHILLEVRNENSEITEITFYRYEYENGKIVSARQADNLEFEDAVEIVYMYEF